MARKTKYTPETIERLTQAIKLGASYDLACKYAGITFQTFNEWRKEKAEFSERVKEAEGMAAVGWLAKIEKAASNGAWQAAAWKLERRYPEEYGQRQRIDARHTITDHRQDAEAIAAEIGKADDPAVVAQIERDLLLSQEPSR